MKRMTFYVIISIAFISCNSNKNGQETEIKNNNTKMDSINSIPMKTDSVLHKEKKDIVFHVKNETKVTDEFEKLDMELFQQCMAESMANDLGYVYTKRLESDVEIELDGGSRGRNNTITEITYKETHPDSYFTILKVYDGNGCIKEKGLIITHSFSILSKIGTWYYFDELGKLTKTIDWDKPLKFTFDDVVAFCKKENIPVAKGIDFPSKTIMKEGEPYEITYYTTIDWIKDDDTYGGIYLWQISYSNSSKNMITDIDLHGQTGKVLRRNSGIRIL